MPVGKIVAFPCPPDVVEFQGTLSPVDVRIDVGAGAGPGEPVTRDTGNEEEPVVAVLFDAGLSVGLGGMAVPLMI